jgi:hypothetical protein
MFKSTLGMFSCLAIFAGATAASADITVVGCGCPRIPAEFQNDLKYGDNTCAFDRVRVGDRTIRQCGGYCKVLDREGNLVGVISCEERDAGIRFQLPSDTRLSLDDLIR